MKRTKRWWRNWVWSGNDYSCAHLENLYLHIRYGFLSLICRWRGHKLVSHGSAGPEHGNDDHACTRCGRYWSVPLY